jgi:hypothetical protein
LKRFDGSVVERVAEPVVGPEVGSKVGPGLVVELGLSFDGPVVELVAEPVVGPVVGLMSSRGNGTEVGRHLSLENGIDIIPTKQHIYPRTHPLFTYALYCLSR